MTDAAPNTTIPCPNPTCSGRVSPDQVVCSQCGHQLSPCPSCAKLMSKTLGLCGWCGHRLAQGESPQALPIEQPVVVWFESFRPQITEILAQVYQQAALAEADMTSVTRLVEQARTCLLGERDAFKIWNILDELIGEADEQTLRPALVILRNWFKQQLFSQHRSRLQTLFERDPERGWREWLRTYAECLSRWRVLFCIDLVDAPFPFPEQFHAPYSFKRITRLILHDRWTQVYQFFIFLSELEFLHPYTRARLMVPAGQIHLYYFSFPDQALTLFQRAEQLAPGLARVLTAFGEYYQAQDDFARSRTYLEQAMRAAPAEVDSYVFMGNLAEKQGKLEEARNWYQEAMDNAGSDSSGYSRLIRLYGKEEFLEQYESHLVPLARQAIAIDETGEYRIYLDVGDAYSASLRYDTAHQWYDKAVDLDPSRLDGYIWKGYTYMEAGETRYEDAGRAFENAIRVAPEAYEGYWGLGQLAERREQWEEAIQLYEKTKDRQPEFYSGLQSRIGEMYWKLGNLETAEMTLLDALKHDPTNDASIRKLAKDYYQQQDKPEKALQLFTEIRQIKGDSFEASYQNDVGNLYYYQREYEQAAQHYTKASQANETEQVYYQNLSLAYRELGRWEEALVYLKKGYEQQQDQPNYESNLLQLFNAGRRSIEKSSLEDVLEQLEKLTAAIQKELETVLDKKPFLDLLDQIKDSRRFVASYGAHALQFSPTDKAIRIYISSDVLPFIVDEKENLLKDFKNGIDELRGHLRQRTGLTIPGLTFSELTSPETPSGFYQILIMDRQRANGQIDTINETDVQGCLLSKIESTINEHIDQLCGHQEAANLLDACNTPECNQIKGNKRKLIALTRELKNTLKKQKSIADLAPIAAEVNQRASNNADEPLWPKHLEHELPPGIESLTLYARAAESQAETELAQKFTNLQQMLFDELGIIMPKVKIEKNLIGFQLQINDRKLPRQYFDAPEDYLNTELRRQAYQLLTLEVVKRYLMILETNFPDLVKVVQYSFSPEILTQLLRDRLRDQASIRNLPCVLEELLADVDIQ